MKKLLIIFGLIAIYGFSLKIQAKTNHNSKEFVLKSYKSSQTWRDTILEDNIPCYIIEVDFYDLEDDALKRKNELKNKGFNAGYLNTAFMGYLHCNANFLVYIGPYKTKELCQQALDKYSEIFPGAYGELLDNDGKIDQVFSKQDKENFNTIYEMKSGTYFRIKTYLPKEEYAQITSDIYVFYKGKLNYYGSIAGYGRFIGSYDFKNRGVPENALEMCFSWWAGVGFYLYLINTDKGLAIYKGIYYEEQEENSYNWEFDKIIDQ